MTPRSLTLLLLGALALTTLALLTHRTIPAPHPRHTPSATATSASSSTPTVAITAPSAAVIDRQDHYPPAVRRAEAAAITARPMLPALPLTYQGVSIQIAGLATNGQSTVLALSDGRLGRAHAVAVYRHELAIYGDSGRAYRIEVNP